MVMFRLRPGGTVVLVSVAAVSVAAVVSAVIGASRSLAASAGGQANINANALSTERHFRAVCSGVGMSYLFSFACRGAASGVQP